jgi:hypothetical protein
MPKTIHDVARDILSESELPKLDSGLCFLFMQRAYGNTLDLSIWAAIRAFMPIDALYLPTPGHWTDQRLNCVILLAITDPEEFE